MRQLLAAVEKNLKFLLRSKVSALIIIFGPLLVALFVGLAFNNTSLFNVKVGVYSPNYDNVTESFANKLREKDFSVTQYTDRELCMDSIKQGVVHACMVFPEDFDLAKTEGNEITFYVDTSRVNLVYTIMDTLSAGISSRTKEISTGLVQVLLDSLTSTKSRLATEDTNLVRLVEQNELIRAKQKEIDSKLDALDLTVDPSSLNSAEVKSTYNARLAELRSMESSVKAGISTSKSILDNSSDSSNAAQVKSKLDVISANVTGLGLNGTTWSSLTGMVDTLDSAVSEVSGQMNEADTARSGVKSLTATVKTTLDTNLNTVMSVKGTVGDITTEIGAIEVTDVAGIVSPISTNIEPVAASTYITSLYPSLVVLLIMFTTVMLGSTLILNEKRSKAFFRNLVSPVRQTLFIYSTYVTVLIVLAVQLFIVFMLTHFFLKIEVLHNTFSILLLTFIITTVFTFIGIVVGNLFSTEETAALASVSASCLMLFLSNMILPLETMPLYIQSGARFNPFVVAERVLREAILFKVPLSAQLKQSYFTGFIPAIYLLLIYAVLLFMGVLVLQNTAHRLHLLRRVGLSRRHEMVDTPSEPVEGSIPSLLKQGRSHLGEGKLEQARALYITINEAYTRLSKPEKKEHYKHIVVFRDALDKALEKKGKDPGKDPGKEQEKEQEKEKGN